MTDIHSLNPAPEVALSRRKVLQLGGVSFAALTTSGISIAADHHGELVKRKEFSTMDAKDDIVLTFKEGVAKMKERSKKNVLDPLSWQMQGSTHAIFCSDAEAEFQVHYGWFFLPWHRGYLYTLEEKIRRLTGNKKFALPYWDWTKHPSIPGHFFGDDNPMSDPTRIYGPDDKMPADFLDLRGIIEAPVFHNFGGYDPHREDIPKIEGTLENSSHNNVHNWIGGNMASFSGAGFDPIFYTHHNMVDRIWEAWKAHNPKANKDPKNSEFLEYEFQYFGGSGEIEIYKVKDLLDHTKLGYTFDNLDVNYTLDERDAPKPSKGVKASYATEIDVSDELHAEIVDMGKGGKGRRVMLHFDRMQLPMHPLCVRVFLNNPEAGQETATEGPSFAGTFTFLPIGKIGGPALEPTVALQMDVSKQIGAHLKKGRKITVTMIPVPLKGRAIPETPLQIKGAKLFVDV